MGGWRGHKPSHILYVTVTCQKWNATAVLCGTLILLYVVLLLLNDILSLLNMVLTLRNDVLT